MANKYRNIYCGEVTKEYENKEVRVAGWIENVRNLGSLVFIALRDETGISFSRLVNGSIKEFIDKYDGRAFKVK